MSLLNRIFLSDVFASRWLAKSILILLADACLVIASMWLSFWVRLETFLPLVSAEYSVSTAILFALLLYMAPLVVVVLRTDTLQPHRD